MINFGAGKLIAIPSYLADGSAIANPTPVVFGTLQEVSVDFSADVKTLYGAKRYPIAAAQGKGKIELKAKYAEIDAGVVGSLYFGQAAAAGVKAAVFDYAATIPATPFQLTIDPPGSGTFVADLGVFNAATGAQLARVASNPATGEYTVSAGGQYTFASADEGDAVKISYEYSDTTGGQVWSLSNTSMSTMPSFVALLQNGFDGKNLVCKLNRCVSDKLALPFKSDDFAVYDFDAQAFADAAGDIGYLCMF